MKKKDSGNIKKMLNPLLRKVQDLFLRYRHKINYRIVIAILFIILALLFLSGRHKEPPSLPTGPKIVKTFVVHEELTSITRSFPGRIQASQRAELAFEVAGKIVDIKVKEGDTVKKGDILASLDSRDLANNLAADKARFEEAKNQLERAEELHKSQNIPQSTLDKRRTEFDVAKSRLETSEKAFNDAQLIAPFDGRITKQYVENFQNVQAKQPIFNLHDTNSFEIVINIPEKAIVTYKKENIEDISVRFDALPNNPIKIQLKAFGAEADPKTLTYPIVFTLPHIEGINILPGMTATVIITQKVPSQSNKKIYMIPTTALFSSKKDETDVWVVDSASQTVKKRPIKFGAIISDKAQVLEGLSSGEIIVTAGVDSLSEGTLVSPIIDEEAQDNG
jgi:RND family efflux transporter MFP subunit